MPCEMRAKIIPATRVWVQCIDSIWTLWVDGRPFLRTIDGQGIRQMAIQLRKVLSKDALENN
jgi:hypothetical protein